MYFSSLIKFTANRRQTPEQPPRCFCSPPPQSYSLSTHANTTLSTTKANICDLLLLTMLEKCHAARHPQHRTCRKYPESIGAMIAPIRAILRVSIYTSMSKSVGTTIDSRNGCVRQLTGKQNEITDKHTSQHNASVTIIDRQTKMLSFGVSLCVAQHSVGHNHIQIRTHINKNIQYNRAIMASGRS